MEDRKLLRAAYLLMVRRRRYPGVREWELEKYLGRDYMDVINRLNSELERLGLEVKEVVLKEGDKEVKHFLVVPMRTAVHEELKQLPFRIDEGAVLAIALSLILSRDSLEVDRKEIIDIASTKLPEHRVERSLNRLIRMGYLKEDGDKLRLGLRTYLEMDLDRLSAILTGKTLSVGGASSSSSREGS